MESKSTGRGYCYDVRCLYQFPTKSFKLETSSREHSLDTSPATQSGTGATCEGETWGSPKQCLEM